MLHESNNFNQSYQFVIYSFDHDRSWIRVMKVRNGFVRVKFESERGQNKPVFGTGLIQSTLNIQMGFSFSGYFAFSSYSNSVKGTVECLRP